MENKVNFLTKNYIQDLVDQLKDKAVLTSKQVYKYKRGLNSKILQHKLRWVIRGLKQQEGLNYYKTFTSVVKPISYKLLFTITVVNDLEIE